VESTQQGWDSGQWRGGAACREVDPGLFFPVGVTGLAEVQIADAKAVCGRCAVREICLEFAVQTNQEYGVWGGMSEEERRAIRRERRAERLRAAS
jgi:WhiB family redox-sensing transcriptional regulator